MKPYRVSTTARADLDDFWFYIAQDDAEAADKFIRTILVRFPKLASMPQLGRRRQELSPRLRSFPGGRYVLFYRDLGNELEITQVLHGMRDFPPLFE